MVSVAKEVKISSPVTGVPQASVAYVLYKVGSEYCAATRHNITKDALGLGKVISLETLTTQLAKVQGGQVPDILPANVFMSDSERIGWTTKSRTAPMWFNVTGRKRAYNVMWPNLLWIASKRSRCLRVFAIGSSKRPDYKTRIYYAPLMNIDSDGRLCEGSAHLPRTMGVQNLAEIEACVFDSCFTHVNHKKTIKAGTDNKAHVRFWRQKSASRGSVRVGELTVLGTMMDVLR